MFTTLLRSIHGYKAELVPYGPANPYELNFQSLTIELNHGPIIYSALRYHLHDGPEEELHDPD